MTRSLLSTLGALFLGMALVSQTTRAAIDDPLRDPSALLRPPAGSEDGEGGEEGARRELAVRISSARVLVADYRLLRRDFPVLQKFGERDQAQIDAWILRHAGYLAKSQVRQTVVNSPISFLSQDRVKALRPRGYGRALVFSAEGGLLDGKGYGAKEPALGSHSNGLATLGECLREFMMEKTVQTLLRAAGSDQRTIGTYAVIDWGFDVIHSDRSRSPAGAVLRQAHTRAWVIAQGGGNSFASDRLTAEIEMIFRHYGLTSGGDTWHASDHRLNVQISREKALVDFGAYLVVDSFELPAFAYLYNGPAQFSDSRVSTEVFVGSLLHPEDPAWMQPDPRVRLPIEWGGGDPKADGLWKKAHDWSNDLRAGRVDVAGLRARVDGELSWVRQRLETDRDSPAWVDRPHSRPMKIEEKFSRVKADGRWAALSVERRLNLLGQFERVPESEERWLDSVASSDRFDSRIRYFAVLRLARLEPSLASQALSSFLKRVGFVRNRSNWDWSLLALAELGRILPLGPQLEETLLFALSASPSSDLHKRVLELVLKKNNVGQRISPTLLRGIREFMRKGTIDASKAFSVLVVTAASIDAEFFRGPVSELMQVDGGAAWSVLLELDESAEALSRDAETIRMLERFISTYWGDREWVETFPELALMVRRRSAPSCEAAFKK